LLSIGVAAAYLSCSTWLVRRLVEEGALHRVQLSGSRRLLLDRHELDELVAAGRGEHPRLA
jgi:excisionase family DNA binding protein